MPLEVISKEVIEGNAHRTFEKTATELGLVFEMEVPFQINHHFMICDSSLARTILEGDKKKAIPAASKRSTVKTVDAVTSNTPNILSKDTHGEG